MDKIWPSLIMRFSLIFLSASIIWQSTAIIPNIAESNKNTNSIVQHPQQFNPSKLIETHIEGSGANPDDEDGDVNEEGSGDGIEGSGTASADDTIGGVKEQKDESKNGAPINVVNINNLLLDHTSSYVQTTFTPSTVITSTTTTPATSAQKISTTITSMTIKLPTTVPTSRPKYYITTTPRNENRPKQIPHDPINPLDGLRPGIFAGMIGGAVVLLLLTILVFTYVLYRIRKKDEGTYVCEESNLQPHHYSYAYQKASIKEFYA